MQVKLLIWIAGGFLLLGLYRILFAPGDWQGLRLRACDRCARAVKLVENLAHFFDLGAGVALYFLALAPFVAAAKGEGFSPDVLVGVVAIALAFTAIVAGSGSALLQLPFWRGRVHTFGDGFLTGVRLVGTFASILLLSRGVTQLSVVGAVHSMAGWELGDRLIAAIGARPIRDGASALFACVTISCGLRWCMPFMLGSRPLVLAKRITAAQKS
jgi:hypothetical protein